jgi:hypothetical protein
MDSATFIYWDRDEDSVQAQSWPQSLGYTITFKGHRENINKEIV